MIRQKMDLTPERERYLDGDPADFPNRESAMAEYRALWNQFLLGESEPDFGGRRMPIEDSRRRMDSLQEQISRGPGPVWKKFTASMPGYLEWWGGVEDMGRSMIDNLSKQ